MSTARSSSAPPRPGATAAPVHIHMITVYGTTYRIWTRSKTFHHDAYFKVLDLLRQFESQHEDIPATLRYLEDIVFEYLISEDSKKDKAKFALLVHAGSRGQTERIIARLKMLLEERKDEMAVKEVAVDLRLWEKGMAIDQRHAEQLVRDEQKRTRMLEDLAAQPTV